MTWSGFFLIIMGCVGLITSQTLHQTDSIKEIEKFVQSNPINKTSVLTNANNLGKELVNKMFMKVTDYDTLKMNYNKQFTTELYDPEKELAKMASEIEKLLQTRENAIVTMVEDSVSTKPSGNTKLTSGHFGDWLSNPSVHNCMPYLDIESDESDDYDKYKKCRFEFPNGRTNDHSRPGLTICDDADNISLSKCIVKQPMKGFDVNFNGHAINTNHSMVVVPIIIYERDLALLTRIKWTDEWFEKTAKSNLQKWGASLKYQMYCDSSGPFRYFPASKWQVGDDGVDMFDCRLTPWYIEAVTGPKQIIIIVDASGSMEGRRFEIAKQLIETIFETMTVRDYFTILPFNKRDNSINLTPCSQRLFPATVRNKKYFRAVMNNITRVGLAEFENAFEKVFNTFEAENDTAACDHVIILITDFAPKTFEKLLDKLNKDRNVRIFTYLVGQDSTDYEEVMHMACHNNGYYNFVPRLEAVQDVIHNYVSVVSRPYAELVAKQTRDGKAIVAQWSSMRVSNMYRTKKFITVPETWRPWAQLQSVYPYNLTLMNTVITVSAPVVNISETNTSFLGVVATDVLVYEIKNKMQDYRLGPNAYAFMLDSYGNMIFHPQMRSMTIPHKNIVDAIKTWKSMDPSKRPETVPYNITSGERSYIQSTMVYARGLKHFPYIIGIGIPSDGLDTFSTVEKRNRIITNTVSPLWGINKVVHCLKQENWRLNNDLRYCDLQPTSLNLRNAVRNWTELFASGANLSAECDVGRLSHLVHDVIATCTATWNKLESDKSSEKLISEWGLLTRFVSTLGGLLRYTDLQTDLDYQSAVNNFDLMPWEYNMTGQDVIDGEDFYVMPQYFHVADYNTKTTEEEFYQRALRFPDKVIFDVDLRSRVNVSESMNFGVDVHGNDYNTSFLLHAFKSVNVNKNDASIGAAVAGIKMVYASFSERVHELLKDQCTIKGIKGHLTCYLIDENGMVVFTTANDSVMYPTIVGQFLGIREQCAVKRMLDPLDQQVNKINEQNVILERHDYVDYQAICRKPTENSAIGLINPLVAVVRLVFWTVKEFVGSFFQLSAAALLQLSTVSPVHSYTENFRRDIGLSCDKRHVHYTVNKNSKHLRQHIVSDKFRCNEKVDCRVSFVVNPVDGTNLYLVVVNRDEKCHDCIDTVSEAHPFDTEARACVDVKDGVQYFPFGRQIDFTMAALAKEESVRDDTTLIVDNGLHKKDEAKKDPVNEQEPVVKASRCTYKLPLQGAKTTGACANEFFEEEKKKKWKKCINTPHKP